MGIHDGTAHVAEAVNSSGRSAATCEHLGVADPELRAHLRDLGASDAQLVDLDDEGLIGLAGDLQLAAGLRLDLEGLGRETGRTLAELQSIYGQLGLRTDDLAGFGDGDVAMINLISADTVEMVAEVVPQLLRVSGGLLGRLAEASVAAYVQDVEHQADDGIDLVALADQNVLGSALAVALGDNLSTVFRHHMWTAVRRQRQSQLGVEARELVRTAIGFVDLVGFTSLSRSVPPAELIAAIEDFERRAFETAIRHGGRIVKSIGDEVMIAAREPGEVAAIALELIDNTGDDPSVSPRGGVSAGDVLFRLGDYYGPVVNLASRLTAEAVPGEVLTDLESMEGPGLTVIGAGRRTLKGIEEPVPVWSIEQTIP